MKFKIDIVSDIVCPWCFVGKRRLESAIAELSEHEFEIDTLPFQLNPDIESGKVLLQDYLEKKFGGKDQIREMQERLEGIAQAEGIQMDFTKVTYAFNTLKAHALIQSVKDKTQKMKLKEALLSAYFEHGQDIDSDEVLRSIAKANQVAFDENFMESGKIEAIRKKELQLKQMGINAVPTFILNNQYLVQGAQSKETFLQVFKQLKENNPA